MDSKNIFSDSMKIVLRCGTMRMLVFLVISGFLSVGCGGSPADGAAAEIKELVGSRIRVAWVQNMGNGSDFEAQGDQLRLMGLDSVDSRGEFPILNEITNVARPLITRRGNRVIFSNRRTGKVYIVNWDGSGRRELTHGLGVAVWIDPASDEEWVFVARPGSDTDDTGWPMGSIWRYPMDRAAEGELVWDMTHVDVDNFQVSADGSRAGGLFPWPSGGVALLPNISWQKYAEGCWTSMAPDNSYSMWVFDGSHRDLFLFDAQGRNRRMVNLSRLPGINNHEVNHPRWSNHPSFMVMTAPYRLEGGMNRLKGGGAGVEIFIGRFDDEHTRIEELVQLTHNARGDYFPDLWIEDAALDAAASQVKAETDSTLVTDLGGLLDAWRVDPRGTVFIWENRVASNQINDEAGTLLRSCRVEPIGYARYGRFSDMIIQCGGFTADDFGKALAEACAVSNQLSIEALITPKAVPKRSARIISYRTAGGDDEFCLSQVGDSLVFEIRTADANRTTVSRVVPLRLRPMVPVHLLLSYKPGKLVCYADGKPVLETDTVKGGLANWRGESLSFGRESSSESSWTGRLEGIALLSRFIDPDEAQMRAASNRERLNGRKRIRRITMTARLVEPCPVPDPRSIAPYRRALVVQRYALESADEADLDLSTVLIAHWAILDGRAVPGLPPPDTTEHYRFTVERFEDHPELEPERLIMNTDDFESPLFYDVGDIGADSDGNPADAALPPGQ